MFTAAHVVSLFLVILKMPPEYDNTIWNSNFGTVAATRLSTYMLLGNFDIYFSTHFLV